MQQQRDATTNTASCIGIVVADNDTDLVCSGYTSLADNPEVFTACRRIASLISSMPIMLMENGDSGDLRIFNELSRKLDIEPCKYMTRRTWMEAIVMNMLLYGNGNGICVPHTYEGIIMDPPSYGRGTGGEIWKLEDAVYEFVELASQVLSDDPLMVLINSYTTGLSPSVMKYILGSVVSPRFGGEISCDEIGLMTTETGLHLPCGASAVWHR